MRSIPFKRVCLLGMNDSDYPRQNPPRDFDLIGHSARAGDRSRREDDRYLFLEALLSAREKLYISWQGRRATDNAVQPPSVLVAQLMDFLDAGWTPERKPVLHPLQAFDATYFEQGSHLHSFDSDWARVQQGPSTVPESVVAPLASQGVDIAAPSQTVQVAQPDPLPWFDALDAQELRRLLRQPVEVFFRSRLNLVLDELAPPAAQDEPFELSQLEKHQLGQRLLQAPDLDRATAELRQEGSLPMASFGLRRLQELQGQVLVVQERRSTWLQAYPHPLPVQPLTLVLADEQPGRVCTVNAALSELRVSDTGRDPRMACLQLAQRSGRVADGSGAQTVPRAHVVAALWVNHVLACAAGFAMTSVQLGWDQQVVFNPLEADQARAILQRWLLAYRQAWQRPLPVACKTAWAYLRQTQEQGRHQAGDTEQAIGIDAHERAAKVFQGNDFAYSELKESAYLARAFDSYEDLRAELPHWAQTLYGDLARHARLDATGQGAL